MTDTNPSCIIIIIIVTSMVYYRFKLDFHAIFFRPNPCWLYSIISCIQIVIASNPCSSFSGLCLLRQYLKVRKITEFRAFHSPMSPDQAQEPQEHVIKTQLTFWLSSHHSKCVWVCVMACSSDSRQPSLSKASLYCESQIPVVNWAEGLSLWPEGSLRIRLNE